MRVALIRLILATKAAAAAAPSPRGTACARALEASCGPVRSSSVFECSACCGRAAAALHAAGCQNDDISLFCAQMPPRPDGATCDADASPTCAGVRQAELLLKLGDWVAQSARPGAAVGLTTMQVSEHGAAFLGFGSGWQSIDFGAGIPRVQSIGTVPANVDAATASFAQRAARWIHADVVSTTVCTRRLVYI